MIRFGGRDRRDRLSPRWRAHRPAPPQLYVAVSTLLFPAPRGGLLDLNHFRLREWTPAIEAAAIKKPTRIYDLRSTFASDALAAGVSPFELARIMGTSVRMIERHYGSLLGGALEGIAARLDALDREGAIIEAGQ